MNHFSRSPWTRFAALSFTLVLLTNGFAQNLPESVHKVLERYPAVSASMARIESAQADIQRAKGAHWPQLSWSGTYSQYHESTLVNHWIQSPTVNMNLWSGLKIQSDVERAKSTTQARREQHRMTRDDISLLATESYLGWALQKNLVALAMANLATHQKILSDYQSIVQIDPGRRIDMNQAQVRHDNAQLSLIQRQSDLKNAELRLKRLLLDELPEEPGGLDNLKDAVPSSVIDALDSLNKDHPVMANWKAQLDAARAGVVNARSQYSPTAQVSYGRQTYPGIAQGVYVSQFILNVPIWDGGSTSSAVKTAQANLDAIEFTEASTELSRIESELAQTRENSLAREDAFRRTVIRAPMDGIVKNVQVTTLGAVVASGQNIMEIVPVQDAMLVEAYVKPSEIAFLEVNQPATVKLTAYEFSRYGGLEGVVEHLSPDTLRDESKPRKPGEAPVDLEEGFYRVLIRVTDKSLERHGKKIQTLPGMTASIEIKTGEKSVLEYLWRPLKNLSQALKER